MQLDARVGIISASTGSMNPLRSDTDGSLVVQNGSADLVDAAINGRLFHAASALTNTGTTLDTSFVGLGICNPTGSGKLLVLHKFSYALVKAAAAANVLCLASNTETGFAAAITPACARHGYATSVALVDGTATVDAGGIIVKVIGSLSNANTNTWPNLPATVNLNGSIVVKPGRSIVTDTITAVGAAAIMFSFTWEEVNL